ncbi:hypothetical protein B9Z65_5908 [Elsinoe australis]|uniref:Uncharacterized protein n=1 Tax=Elsinoe australis TaxID=40998 RepID=A0A2P7YJF0_9PEZI|nr:hypothetical protein B9Z65_5908 [Elsinoe australis]
MPILRPPIVCPRYLLLYVPNFPTTNGTLSCSIPCYKQHKIEHEASTSAADTVNTVSIPAAPQAIPGSRPTLPGQAKTIDFSGFEKDPVFLDLLKKDPKLRIKLQSVFGYTLEPPPPRGGRGGFRGRGRGFGDRHGGVSHGGPWTQAKGDAEALEKLAAMRDEDEDGSVAELIKLVGLRFGEGVKDDASRW